MSYKEITALVAQSLSDQLDNEIYKAVSYHLGHYDWSASDVLEQGTLILHQSAGAQTFAMNGVPLLEIYPAEHLHTFRIGAVEIAAERKFRRLYEHPNNKEPAQ